MAQVEHGTPAGHRKHLREARKDKPADGWGTECPGANDGTTCAEAGLSPRKLPDHGTKSGYNRHLWDDNFGTLDDCPGHPKTRATCREANAANSRRTRALKKAKT